MYCLTIANIDIIIGQTISIFVIKGEEMSREKFKTLTEQMFYILLCLHNECCGTDIMSKVSDMTDGRVRIGPGTLYNLLDQFAETGLIIETRTEGRKRSYILTEKGEKLLRDEYDRILLQIRDYDAAQNAAQKEGKLRA